MNAKEELCAILDRYDVTIKCAEITTDPYFADECTVKPCSLKVGHTNEELMAFLEHLNIDYDNGYGGQNLFGVIWLTNGTWLSRGEYDGSEWWNYNIMPMIPTTLLNYK